MRTVMKMNLNNEEFKNYIQEADNTELSEKIQQYFAWYQERLERYKQITGEILVLQDKLIRMKSEQKNIRAHNRKLKTLAMYDPLTGLANRGYLNEYLSQKFEEAYKKQISLGVELMDIDHFKSYNDTFGHLAGDVCISEVAKVLKQVQNDKVFCSRYGGDEFLIVYSEMTTQEIRSVAEEIQRKVRELELTEGTVEEGKKITVSQGIFVCIPEEENREWDFNSMADTALYHAKRDGRNRYRIVTEFES